MRYGELRLRPYRWQRRSRAHFAGTRVLWKNWMRRVPASLRSIADSGELTSFFPAASCALLRFRWVIQAAVPATRTVGAND